ncbi:hypothetical protein [Nocardia asiatica]|uniref:hypothetical protein n=1 Tax=Nocardia asiatica TaxID=209252 RepID=UPI002453CE31|nr:hypothetical protein [Nocardia asiatica]
MFALWSWHGHGAGPAPRGEGDRETLALAVPAPDGSVEVADVDAVLVDLPTLAESTVEHPGESMRTWQRLVRAVLADPAAPPTEAGADSLPIAGHGRGGAGGAGRGSGVSASCR